MYSLYYCRQSPTIAQLVERETVVSLSEQISLGRWFKSGSVECDIFHKILAVLLIIVLNNPYLHVFFILLYTTTTDSSVGRTGDCSLLVRLDISRSVVVILLGGMWYFS